MLDKNEHDIINNLKLVGKLDGFKDFRPYVVIPADIAAKAQHDYFKSAKNKFTLIVHPFSGQTAKRWDMHNYAYLCSRLIEEKGVRVIVVGSCAEKENADAFMREVGASIELCFPENILYTAAVISGCDLFLGNDSSLMHIAGALEKPTIAIWGFTDYKRVSPYGEDSVIIRKNFRCAPCYSFEHGFEGIRCTKVDCLTQLDKTIIYEIVSLAIESLRLGKRISAVPFEEVRAPATIEILQSRCRMLTIS